MRKFVLILLLASFCFAIGKDRLSAQVDQSQRAPVSASFFGLEEHWFLPAPLVPYSQSRLWGTGTTWATLNPSQGVYNWVPLDAWLEASGGSHKGVLYTMAFTPTWASSKPGDTNCREGLGECDPPNDLNPDGTGPDQHWKDFVNAIATRAAGRIKYWEIWNEPIMPFYWTGTFQQMARMAKDARTIILSIDPQAKLLSPPNGAGGKAAHWIDKWWEGYNAAGGFQHADIIAMHGGLSSKCGAPPQASDFIGIMQDLRRMLAIFHQNNKPVWDTESNWGSVAKNCFTNQDLQAAFLGQFYLLHVSENLQRFYWYSYADPNTGQLFDVTTGKLDKAGVALQQVHPWLLGRTLTKTCSSLSGVWTCGLSGPGGYNGEVVWDTNETCQQGVACKTQNYSVDKMYKQYRTLSGEVIGITDNRVPIGAKPILVEN